MNAPLLARLGQLPGYSAAQLPDPTEVVLNDLTRQLGEAAAYDLWLGVLFVRVAAATPAEAETLSKWLTKAGDIIRSRQAEAAALAIERRLPDWLLAIRAVAAALPAPLSLPVGPDAPEPRLTNTLLPKLLEALFTWFLKVSWTLYCFLPDKGKAVAAALADELPAVLRRDGLYGGIGVYFMLQKAPRTPQRLAALVSEALGPYPARARWVVLRWAHTALHEERPTGLKTFAKALAKAAPAWTDAAFDLLLHEAVLYVNVEDEQTQKYVKQLAPALFFRRQPDRRAVLEALHAQARTTPEAAQLATLLHTIEHPDAAPAPPPPPADAVVLPNLVLRLGIIHELMFRRGLLGARFDVYEFANAYAGREIDVEADGYEPIPEVVAYFAQLPLTPALLAQVEVLSFEFGKPDFDIVSQVFPFDDGEGDELQLTSLAGIEHCPNLEAFYLCSLPPDFVLPDLSPLLRLPKLKKAHLDRVFAADPTFAALGERVVIVEE